MRQMERSRRVTTAVLCLPMLLALGCQTGFRKPTHAAQQCLSKDHRYLPSGTVIKPSNQVQAVEEYKLEREQQRAALAKDDQ